MQLLLLNMLLITVYTFASHSIWGFILFPSLVLKVLFFPCVLMNCSYIEPNKSELLNSNATFHLCLFLISSALGVIFPGCLTLPQLSLIDDKAHQPRNLLTSHPLSIKSALKLFFMQVFPFITDDLKWI